MCTAPTADRMSAAGDRARVKREARPSAGLTNVLMLGHCPRARCPRFGARPTPRWSCCAAADIRACPAVQAVRGDGLGKPVVLGVEGEAKALIEAGGAGHRHQARGRCPRRPPWSTAGRRRGLRRGMCSNGRQWARRPFRPERPAPRGDLTPSKGAYMIIARSPLRATGPSAARSRPGRIGNRLRRSCRASARCGTGRGDARPARPLSWPRLRAAHAMRSRTGSGRLVHLRFGHRAALGRRSTGGPRAARSTVADEPPLLRIS